MAGTSETWSFFEIRWKEYKDGTKLDGADVLAQLLECCDKKLRKDLTNAAGKSLVTDAEGDLLKAIKTLAVQAKNTMVARVTLSTCARGGKKPYGPSAHGSRARPARVATRECAAKPGAHK